ncbi:GNAT family N-acetyltransferase [Bacteroidales bacterium OttesenSCG-928-A17]|nr:GNAT family N-acetyltransferase [Bacteroidales bacterium OttesenSCG-928-A17]
MKKVIAKIDRKILKSELTTDKLFRKTNKSKNEIYLFTAHNAPNLMQEVGRLREEAFRYYGGGTGESTDIDEFDTMENPYRQLIVWDPNEEEILGGYRFRCGNEVTFGPDGQPNNIATAELFHFSQEFIDKYLNNTVELGRSFVSLDYQSSKSGYKGLFALDNLWDGLGALSVIDPDIRYFFGKVTMYDNYNTEARNMVLFFLNKYFGDRNNLITPVHALVTNTDEKKMAKLFHKENYKEDYRVLNEEVRKHGINIPPLVSAYMNLSPSMKVFGTAVNQEFGNVEETGILIDFNDVFEDKKMRHIESFLQEKPSQKLLRHIRERISQYWEKPKSL